MARRTEIASIEKPLNFGCFVFRFRDDFWEAFGMRGQAGFWDVDERHVPLSEGLTPSVHIFREIRQ
ncbi:hypothetical protein [Zhengella mangrovi]|uniref:hypothetical protein n=1 Tax=Zhengella mangrovi TaxID=1982044 RepID=UPI0010553C85|nr:hypothetical protein [Zhengella mangrovi]